jgi:hypothetical protein
MMRMPTLALRLLTAWLLVGLLLGAVMGSPASCFGCLPVSVALGEVKLPLLGGLSATVPAGTVLAMRLNTPLSSELSKVGDRVEGVLVKGVVSEGRVVLPEGTVVVGEVATVLPAAYNIRHGLLELTFLEVVLPEGGEHCPLKGRLNTADGSGKLRGETMRTTLKPALKRTALSAAMGAGFGLLGAILAGGNIGGTVAVGAGIGAGVGVASALLTSTPMPVELDKGTLLRVDVLHPVVLAGQINAAGNSVESATVWELPNLTPKKPSNNTPDDAIPYYGL